MNIPCQIFSNVKLPPVKASALLALKIAKSISANAAILINLWCNASPSLVAKYPSTKNSGEVPRTKAARIAAPMKGLADPIDNAIIA